MPGRYYMGVDFRRDHSMRIPRPDLSMEFGTPNACNQCHTDQSAEWAYSHTEKWYGIKKRQHFGEIMALAVNGDTAAIKGLISLAIDELNPPLVRAAATGYLSYFPGEPPAQVNKQMLNDPEAVVRREAVQAFIAHDLKDYVQTLSPLLNDPTKLVRLEVTSRLSSVPPKELDSLQKSALDTGIQEYIKAMEYGADFTTSRHNLGNLYANLGQNDKAIENYTEAIRIDNQFYPAKINLAMTFNSQGNNAKAEKLFREVLVSNPELDEVYYSLGLLLAENKKYDEAIKFLQQASRRMPDRARIYYNLGILLQYKNRKSEASKALNKTLELEPDNIDFLYAAADFYIKTGDFSRAKIVVEQIIEKYPNLQLGYDLLNVIRSG